MEAFIDDLHVDWTTDPPEVSVPALVPPLAVKPIICTEYLERWYECGQAIKAATTILIAGYSFSVADEHFNDLLRKGNPRAKLIVVDPKIDGVIDRVRYTLNHDKTRLRPTRIQELDCKADDQLMFVQAKAEDLNSGRLLTILDNAAQVPPPKQHS